MTDAIEKLRQWLDQHQNHLSTEELVPQLAAVWHHFAGAEDTQMAAYKLSRLEDLSWDPPVLSFAIERHGAIVGGGSSRAELQTWQVDLDAKTASLLRSGRFRQVYPAAPRLDVRPIAREIAEIAATHQEDERLRRNAKKIIVLVGKIKELAPGSAVKQTLAARRSRFTTALAEEMRAHGFIRDPTVKGSLAWYTYIEQQDNPGPADSA